MMGVSACPTRAKASFILQPSFVFLLLVLHSLAFAEKSYKSSCETIPSEIHITKGNNQNTDIVWTHELYYSELESTMIYFQIIMFLDEFDKASGISRTCEQSVAVNKCEGACASSLRPSALNSNGFSKVKIIGISD